jgi:hypothetical protein
MRSSHFNSILIAIVAISAVVTVSQRDHVEPFSTTRVNNLEITGTTQATGLITATAGVTSPSDLNGDEVHGNLVTSAGDVTAAEDLTGETVQVSEVGNAAFASFGPGQSAAVSGASAGRIRYNASTQKFQVSENGGAYANVSTSTAGAGLYAPIMGTIPTAANTGFSNSWYLWTGGTYTDGELGPLLVVPTTSGNFRYSARGKAAPATPYTITLLLAASFPVASVSISGGLYVGWGEAATGAANKGDFAVSYPGQSSQMYRDQMTNATTNSAHTTLSAAITSHPWVSWWRLRDDGTTATISISTSGDDASFLPVYTVTKAGSFLGATGYNYVLWGCNASAGSGTCQLMAYELN